MRRVLFLIAASTLWFAGIAAAQSKPHIVTTPSADEIAQYYPERAQRFEVGGKARIRCLVEEGALLSTCQLVHEWPEGFSFGDAALKMSRLFRAAGGPGSITLSINFALPQSGPGNAYARFISSDASQPWKGRLLNLSSSPTDAQILAAYPPGATTVTRVQIICSVKEGAALGSCVANTQTNIDARFAKAALMLIPDFQISDPAANVAGASVELSILFVPPDPTLMGH